MPTLRVLSKKEIASAITMMQAIDLMREGFTALSAGQAITPVRMSMPVGEEGQRALFMPSFSESLQQIGLKVVTVNPKNPSYGLPFIHALITVHDVITGAPIALMDGEYITSLRTGAGSGVATDSLARPDSSVLAIFGVGVQAHTQIEAICAVRTINKIIVFAKSPSKIDRFINQIKQRYDIDTVAAHAAEDLSHADIVCTATTSMTPVFSHQNLSDGTHINGIGSYRPDMSEIPPQVVARAKVVVDHRDACLSEAGDLSTAIQSGLIDESHIHAEIGEVLLNRQEGRTHDSEVTFFKSVGNAIQDLVVASYVVKKAEMMNLGTEITL